MLMALQWRSASYYGGQCCDVTWLLGSTAIKSSPFRYEAIADPSVGDFSYKILLICHLH